MGYSESKCEQSPVTSNDADILRHELSNVLNGFAGMARLLRSTAMNRQQELWLAAIESSADQMEFLLRDEDPGSSQKGGRDAMGDCLDGVQFMEGVVLAHTPTARERGLRLLLRIAPNLAEFWRCEPGPLRQLLDNLLGNAFKFTESGDILLSAEPGDDHALRLSVRDSGPGVEESERDRIFEIRERGSGSGIHPGQGIGLAVCRDIVTRMNGRIGCVSDGRSGTEFVVLLPGVLENPQPPPKSTAFENLRCRLELDASLTVTVEMMLDRLGIDLDGVGDRSDRASDRVQVLIRETSAGGSGLTLADTGRPSPEPLRLEPPILQSGLERALLALLLDRRWRNVSPGGNRR